MSRAELVQSIVAGLPAGSDFVVDPDHPLLLRGPDVLASYRGMLTAYFGFIHRNRWPLASLLPKVVLSRFALPSGTSFVLVLDSSVDLANEETSLFEQVVVAADERRAQVPVGRMYTSAGAEAAEPLRMFHHERFADAWASSTRGRKPTRRTPGEPTSLYGQRAPRLTAAMARYTDYDNGQFYFTSAESESEGRPRTWLSSATDLVVRTDYDLDDGLFGLSQISGLTLSGDTYLPLHRNSISIHAEPREFDALKRLRAAAFAGIATRWEPQNVA